MLGAPPIAVGTLRATMDPDAYEPSLGSDGDAHAASRPTRTVGRILSDMTGSAAGRRGSFSFNRGSRHVVTMRCKPAVPASRWGSVRAGSALLHRSPRSDATWATTLSAALFEKRSTPFASSTA